MRSRNGLSLSALLAIGGMAVSASGFETKQPPGKQVSKGRRAEKDAIALAKAEAKRKRRAEKRLKALTPNVSDNRTTEAGQRTRGGEDTTAAGVGPVDWIVGGSGSC